MMADVTTTTTRKPAPAKRPTHPQQVILTAGLPGAIAALITDITKRTRLWRSEQTDVARELVAHFADGLEARRTPDELIRHFGSPATAARLIRRAKKRNRPLWWQIGLRLRQAFLILIAFMVLSYAVLALRFYTGSPTIARNYLAELNAPIRAIPEAQRAEPIYLSALDIVRNEPNSPDDSRTNLTAVAGNPADEHWPVLAAYIQANQHHLATIRRAAALPALGHVAGYQWDSAWQINPGPPEHHPVATSDNEPLMMVLLPHLGPLRRMAMYLHADTYLALEAKDGARAAANLDAMIGMADHAREFPTLIGDLVSMAIINLAASSLTSAIADGAAASISDADLARLAHRFAAFPSDGDSLIRIGSERTFWNDSMQRLYTDDGAGNGRITASGLRQLTESLSFADDPLEPSNPFSIFGPVSSAVIADRRSMTDKYNDLMSRMEAMARTPLWQQTGGSPDAELDRQTKGFLQRQRYLPIYLLMPALSRAATNAQEMRQRLNAALVITAAELYKRRTGAYPDTLNRLVPTFLPAVPLDRFDGQPLRYARSSDGRFKLWSVGSDLDDDGGAEPSWRPNQATRGKPPTANRWRGLDHVNAARASGEWGEIPDGDWILFPPQN